MAEFRNPVATRIEGEIPQGDTGALDLSRAVGAAIDFGAETATESATSRLGEQITEQARDFTAQPARMDVIGDTARQLEEQRRSRPQMRSRKTMRKLRGDLERLGKAVEQGAASSTEVRMRANQLTRQAIAENPTIAGELIRERNQALGLFSPELEVTDSLLQQDEEQDADALIQQQNEFVVQQLNDMGYLIKDFSQENLDRLGTLVLNILGKAERLDLQARASENRQTIAENAAIENGQAWVQREFLQARGRIEQVLQSDLSDVEKIQAINDAIASLRTSARSNKVLGRLTPSRLDSLVQPAVDRLEQAKAVINGEEELAALRNQWDSMLYQNVIAAASENPAIMSTATATKFGGEIVGQLVSQQSPGGISGQVNSLVDSAIRLIADDKRVSNPDLETLERAGVFDRYFESIEGFEAKGVSQEEARTAAKTLVSNLLPESGVDLTKMELEKWHMALPVLARVGVRDMFERTGITQVQTERLNDRVQQYLDSQLVPNLASRLSEPVVRTREDQPAPGGVREAMARGSNIRETSVIRFVEPVWTNDGRVRLQANTESLPEEVRNDPQKLREFRKQVDRLNTTYVPRWNDAMLTSSNFSLSDPKEISQREWQDQFGHFTEDTGDE